LRLNAFLSFAWLFVEPPFRWNEPHTWPIFFYIWLAFVLVGPLISLWGWLQRERAKSWPSALGRIDTAHIKEPSRFLGLTLQPQRSRPYTALLAYSYSISGVSYSGTYKRDLGSELEANEFLRGLAGQPVTVQYNPSKPSSSALLESTVEALLAQRPPAPPDSATAKSALPAWSRPFLFLLALTSLLGLLVSLWVHVGAMLGHKVAPDPFFILLHVGIFFVWFPAIFVLQKTVGYTRGKDIWKKAFQGSPDGLRYMVYFFFGYAVLNFMLFIPQAPSGKNAQGDPPAIVWRGFSGHWMAFYSAAFAIFLSALNNSSGRSDS
jgi:hypothetical protein